MKKYLLISIVVLAIAASSLVTYFIVRPSAPINKETVLTAKMKAGTWDTLSLMLNYRLNIIRSTSDTSKIRKQCDTINGTIFPIIFHNTDSIYFNKK